jgi:hypothetical protein
MPLVISQHLLKVFVQLANKRGLKKTKRMLYHRSLRNMQECTLKWTNEVFCPNGIQRERGKRDNVFVSNVLYMTCSLCNKCVCAL